MKMKDKALYERTFKGKAPEKFYEVYDETDTNHAMLIYSGTDKKEAIKTAKRHMSEYDIPCDCIGVYELVKQ